MKAAKTQFVIGVFCLLMAAPAAAEMPPGTEVVTGEWQGSLYAIYAPPSWNGDLILYAHGWVPPVAPIALPADIDGFRDMVLNDGYAIAYSSYSENGWAVRQGFKETEHLLPLFRKYFDPPDRVYITGHSMGGLISVMLAEMRPGKYDGALPICGAIGGAVMAGDYLTDVRVLFDAYYPGVLPGLALEIPDGTNPVLDFYFPAFGAIFSDPPDSIEPAIEMSFVTELGMYWNSIPELADATALALWFNASATEDIKDRCGGVFFDNTEGYTHPLSPVYDPPILDEVTLNGVVEHYTIDKNCFAYLKNWYEPDGKLRIPVLSLHESRDPVVPIKHEWEYASRVDSQGRSDLLVQRTKDAFGHCANFSDEEWKAAFDELVLWVEDGVKPAP
jgi:pimeloyl-ACP methyl ester carboxylesterase